MYTNQTAGVISPGAASIVKDGAGNDWIAYRQKLNSATGWSRVETVNRINLDSSGQVSVIPTRNTYVTKPVPLGSTSLPAGPTFTKVENTSSRIHYSGTWTVDSNASDSGGSVSFSGVSGDSAELQFYGTAARVAVRTGINSGIADVKLDGVVVVNNVDTYSTPALYKQIIYEIEGLTEGTHTVSFQPNGTKNALSGMTSARLDYFEYVGPNAVDSSSGSLTYSGSGWGVFNLASDYGGSVKSSQVTGDFMQITLTGTNVKLFARKGPAAGKVDVYLDGVLVKNDFDLYSSSTVSQVLVYDSGTISSGSHTVKYVVTGLKNSSSTGYGNNFDFLVYK
jgi:hypothetical protein